MTIDKLLKAVKEYAKVQKTHESGDKYVFPLVQAKREILLALEEIIDARIKHYINRERKSDTIRDLKSPSQTMDNSLVPFVDALNSAPIPPSSPEDFLNQKNAAIFWLESYNDWFYGKRDKAIKKF